MNQYPKKTLVSSQQTMGTCTIKNIYQTLFFVANFDVTILTFSFLQSRSKKLYFVFRYRNVSYEGIEFLLNELF